MGVVPSNNHGGRNFWQARLEDGISVENRKRMRPEDLDCELETLIKRDNSVASAVKPGFDPTKRPKRQYHKGAELQSMQAL